MVCFLRKVEFEGYLAAGTVMKSYIAILTLLLRLRQVSLVCGFICLFFPLFSRLTSLRNCLFFVLVVPGFSLLYRCFVCFFSVVFFTWFVYYPSFHFFFFFFFLFLVLLFFFFFFCRFCLQFSFSGCTQLSQAACSIQLNFLSALTTVHYFLFFIVFFATISLLTPFRTAAPFWGQTT